jgi:hypothetical protein
MEKISMTPANPYRRRTEVVEEWFEPPPEMCPPGYEPTPNPDGPEPGLEDAAYDEDDE